MGNKFKVNCRLNKQLIEAYSGFNREKYFQEIRHQLVGAGLRENFDFHLGKTNEFDALCLYEEGEFWVVAYFENGLRYFPAFFVDPEDAALFLASKVERKTIN